MPPAGQLTPATMSALLFQGAHLHWRFHRLPPSDAVKALVLHGASMSPEGAHFANCGEGDPLGSHLVAETMDATHRERPYPAKTCPSSSLTSRVLQTFMATEASFTALGA